MRPRTYLLPTTSYFLPVSKLPAALRHARNVALQRQLPEAEAAKRELADVCARPAAQVAAVPQADLVFRRFLFLRDLRCCGHSLSFFRLLTVLRQFVVLNGIPIN